MEENDKQGSEDGIALIALSKDDLRKLLKPRIGFERIAEQLIELFRDNPDWLAQGGVDLAQLEADIEAYTTLMMEERNAKVRARLVLSTRAYHGSRAYATTLRLYERAVVASHASPKMENEIANIVTFMKCARKAAKKPPEPTPTKPP